MNAEPIPTPVLALKLGLDARTVRARMQSGGALTCKIPTARGQTALGWCLADVLRLNGEALAALARRRGYRSAEDYLSANDSPLPYSPPKPSSELPAHHQRDAEKWRDALAEALARQHDLAGELGAFVARQCRAVFGREKTWRKRFDLAVQLDAGFEQWQRLDLYVDPHAYEAAPPSAAGVKLAGLVAPLEEAVTSLRKAGLGKLEYRARLFDAVFRFFERLCDDHPTRRKRSEIKVALLDWLGKAENDLAKRACWIRRTWDRTLPRWIERGRCWEAVLSRCAEANQARSDALLVRWAADLGLIHKEIIKRDGIRPLGYRAAYDLLSDAWRGTYRKDPMPKIVYRAFTTASLKAGVAEHRSPWLARMGGPYIRGDKSDHEPGDWFVFDDATSNSKATSHRFLMPEVCHDGLIFRPEGLFAMDRWSHCFLHLLAIEGHYNSEHQLRLYFELHERLGGLARIGFKIENGPWASRFAIGDRAARRHYGRARTLSDALEGFAQHGKRIEPPEELAMNRPDFGLRISRALPGNPRGKAELECGFNILQNLMRHLPTFVGFNERQDRLDRNQKVVRDFKARVKAGKEDPRNEVPTLEELVAQTNAATEEYNRTRQHGSLQDRSPKECWDEAILRRPLRKLDDDVAHLLATHEKTVRVTERGILLKLRGIVHPYADGPIADWKGDEVRCLYNVFHPEVIWVKHPRVPGLVKLLENVLPKTTATKDQFAEVNGRIAAFRKPDKVVSGEIRHDIRSPVTRDADVSDSTKQLGEELATAIAGHREEQHAASLRVPRLERFAAEIGVEIPPTGGDRERVLRGLERKLALRNSPETVTAQP